VPDANPGGFTYRALSSDDLEAAGQLLVESYPYRAHEPPFWRRPAPREQPRRWGVFSQSSISGQESSAEILAYAARWRVEGEKFRFDVVVSPRYAGHGLGRRLIDLVTHEARLLGAATLQARARDSDAESLVFLSRRGFVETMKMRGFVLELATIEPPLLVTAAGLPLPPDVSIDQVPPAQSDAAGFWEKLTDLHEAARDGWPDPDPGGSISPTQPAELRSFIMPSGEPAVAFFLASRADQFVAYSALVRRQAAGEAQFALTAVRPEARGQGLGTALRARCLLVGRGAMTRCTARLATTP
jgi:GNAT superfamily N-acetyltransferase